MEAGQVGARHKERMADPERLVAVDIGLFPAASCSGVVAEQFGIERNAAIAVSLLIQTLQILPMTALGIALAPEFIFKKGERKKIETIAENRGPIMLGESPKKGEELGGAPS